MEIIKNKRILAIVGLVCLLLGTIMPYFTFSFLGYSQSISLWGYWEGKIILVLIIANGMFIFKDYIEKYVPQLFNSNLGKKIAEIDNPKYSLIPTILIVVFAIYLLTTLDSSSEYMDNGLGFYALWLGIIALVGHSIFYKYPTNENIQPKTSVMQTTPMAPQESTEVQIQQTQVEEPAQNIKYCPNCGTQLDANATTCTNCGNNF